jgi:hypothetical protein
MLVLLLLLHLRLSGQYCPVGRGWQAPSRAAACRCLEHVEAVHCRSMEALLLQQASQGLCWHSNSCSCYTVQYMQCELTYG